MIYALPLATLPMKMNCEKQISQNNKMSFAIVISVKCSMTRLRHFMLNACHHSLLVAVVIRPLAQSKAK